jgi:hypothetical protein
MSKVRGQHASWVEAWRLEGVGQSEILKGAKASFGAFRRYSPIMLRASVSSLGAEVNYTEELIDCFNVFVAWRHDLLPYSMWRWTRFSAWNAHTLSATTLPLLINPIYSWYQP